MVQGVTPSRQGLSSEDLSLARYLASTSSAKLVAISHMQRKICSAPSSFRSPGCYITHPAGPTPGRRGAIVLVRVVACIKTARREYIWTWRTQGPDL